jgi:isoquinoline 1-oxidoreductase subunit beta
MAAPVRIGRRRFLRTSTQAAGALTLAFYAGPWPAGAHAAAPDPAKPLPDPNAFLRIGADGSVTVLLAHSEMGQGMWTGLVMLIAEELDLDWSKVQAEHAPAAPAYAHTAFGMQMTGGSTSIASEFDRYRQVGALARTLLTQAAAEKWRVPAGECRVEAGAVVAGSRRASFGELAEAASRLPRPAQVALEPRSSWTVIGKPRRRLDAAAKVQGRAGFGMDVHFPGLQTALVARSPYFGGRVKRFDGSGALKVPGVKAVVPVPSGVAVIAENFWAAKLGRAALEVEWDPGPGGTVDSEALLRSYRELAGTRGTVAKAAGDPDASMAGAAKVVEAEYDFPYLAHATMEPLNCTVRIAADKCEIWTGTQFQTLDQAVGAEITGLKPEQVFVHTQFLGGGFGRRATPTCDFVREAVHVAKAAGVPVKVVWTREDDMHGGYYRPLFYHKVKVGLDAQGAPLAWQHTLVGQSFLQGTPFEAMVKDGVDPTSVEGVFDSAYVIDTPHHRVELHSPRVPVTTLWWRSVGHTHTGFVMETLMDELAAAAGQDPLAYRRARLARHPRLRAVLDLAAARSGWGRPPGRGRFRGLAVHESFGSVVAQVAEVSLEGSRIRVHRVVCAIDCGTAVNPAGVAAQMESGVVFGLSAALYGEITLRDGRVQQSNFHDYRPLRLNEMPAVEVHIVPSTEPPSGVGEPGVPPVAPAVANAVFAATGQRLRRLPLRLAAFLLGSLLAAPAAPAADSEAGVSAFETVRQVLQHPRCQNCHIPGDAPLQLDDGRPHGQNVIRGADGRGAPGMPCATCHAEKNPPASYGANIPPGAPNWHLPPPQTRMVFINLTPGRLCATLKDRKATGGRDLKAMAEHVAHDPLVLWGWDPGVGRAPVSVPHAQFVEAFRTWISAGAPCPGS